jgi:hypothetical protein
MTVLWMDVSSVGGARSIGTNGDRHHEIVNRMTGYKVR